MQHPKVHADGDTGKSLLVNNSLPSLTNNDPEKKNGRLFEKKLKLAKRFPLDCDLMIHVFDLISNMIVGFMFPCLYVFKYVYY